MSITKTVDFENLLNYWSSGNNPPSANTAVNTLFQLTEDLKLETVLIKMMLLMLCLDKYILRD